MQMLMLLLEGKALLVGHLLTAGLLAAGQGLGIGVQIQVGVVVHGQVLFEGGVVRRLRGGLGFRFVCGSGEANVS